jgi:hypothetical protein
MIPNLSIKYWTKIGSLAVRKNYNQNDIDTHKNNSTNVKGLLLTLLQLVTKT